MCISERTLTAAGDFSIALVSRCPHSVERGFVECVRITTVEEYCRKANCLEH
jgi:hypothetical protein